MTLPAGSRSCCLRSLNPLRSLQARRHPAAWTVLMAALSLLHFPALGATRFEIEPNDTPAEATRLSGAVTVAGRLPGSDQDGLLWTLSDTDAGNQWLLTLQGVPGRLTIVDVIRLTLSDDGSAVTDRKTLFTIGSRDGSRPVSSPPLMFEPGDYLLGVASAGGGGEAGLFRPPMDKAGFGSEGSLAAVTDADDGYRLLTRPGESFRSRNLKDPPEDQGNANPLRLNSPATFYADATGIWHQFDIGERDAGAYWELDVQVAIGRLAQVTMLDADGQQLLRADTDRFGRLNFPDLALVQGRYFVHVSGDNMGHQHRISITPSGTKVENQEAEPNDKRAQANLADLAAPLQGRAGRKGDVDYFRLAVDEARAEELQRLSLTTAGTQGEICLLDSDGVEVQCKRGAGDIFLDRLSLEPGSWGVKVGRLAAGQTYTLTMSAQGRRRPDFEGEPNDSIAYATAISSKGRVKGQTDRNENDFFRLIVTDEPQLWRFQVVGDGIHELAYLDGAGKQGQVIRAASGQRRVRLENVYLLPGTHFIRVTGREAGDYTLLARALGPPDPNAEREPNDDDTRAMPLHIGQTRSGLLVDKADSDNYRFTLRAEDHIRLTITPPADGSVAADLYWDGAGFKENRGMPAGEALTLSGVFPPGNYRLDITAPTPSEAEYTVSLERLPFFSCPADCEPNDSIAFARPLPADGRVAGRVGTWRDQDWYALPIMEQDTPVSVTSAGRRRYELLVPLAGKALRGADQILQAPDENNVRRGTIPAGAQAYLRVDPWGDEGYRLDVDWPGRQSQLPTAPGLDLSVEFDAESVAAYEEFGQRVTAKVSITNTGNTPVSGQLRGTTSDHRWRLGIEEADLEVPAGATVARSVTVAVPRDAWADRSVAVTLALVAQETTLAYATADIVPDTRAVPVSPAPDWPLPEGLLGTFNVAGQQLGGGWRGEEDSAVGRGFAQITDGLAIRGEGLALRGGVHSVEPLTLDIPLAGEDAPVVGAVINLHAGSSIRNKLRELRLELSVDGISYTPVLQETLLPIKGEQAFLLDTPVAANYARLYLDKFFAAQLRPPGGGLGEIKILSRDDPGGGQGYNLAAPQLGGHVVWSEPTLQVQGWASSLLEPGEKTAARRLQAGQPLQWVIGFHNNRAARLTHITWRPGEAKYEPITRVTVAASLESPIGPWQTLGEWPVDPESATRLALVQPTWARFLRFSVAAPAQRASIDLPDAIEVWEQPTSAEYRSILTEWGYGSQAAFYEHTRGIEPFAPAPARTNTRRDAAATLAAGTVETGRVQLGEVEHWYRFVLPAQHNTLKLRLEGNPTVRTRIEVYDAQGESIRAFRVDREEERSAQTWEVSSTPGETLFLRLFEPPRNVAFLWDTSASVGAYLPVIYSALTGYAEDLVPGRDAANLMPFGSPFLMRDWYGDPYYMATVLNDYPRQESSSEAEQTLNSASRGLGSRDGSRAIVLITDAATGKDDTLWPMLEGVRPRVFALGLSSEGAFGRNPERERDLLQDWSRVNRGRYDPVMDEGDMEIAFDRAAALLRRPAPYRVAAESRIEEAPGPGWLKVERKASARNSGAVALILDASGSMLQRIDGRRRIAIAREVLAEAVQSHIPAGTPTYLRVFGNKEANACRTDIEVPLGPLDPAKMQTSIEGIAAKNLARTPIAKSLELTARDLAGVTGRKSIILVTDGEETCDGDPQAVIDRLADGGFDMNLNIVGFAIDDPALAATFDTWARSGNGRYFAAEDATTLNESLRTAVSTAFEVYDDNEELVSTGTVNGEPLMLPQGVYRVVVKDVPVSRFERVQVHEEQATVLNY